MFVKEVFSGLDPKNKPEVKLFENKYKYNEMLVEKDITFSPTVNIILYLFMEKHMWLIFLMAV